MVIIGFLGEVHFLIFLVREGEREEERERGSGVDRR